MKIVLFDGVCNLCSGAVQWIIRHDPHGRFTFASLQSETGKKLKKQFALSNTIDSIVLIENEKAYTESTAALRVARSLQGVWKFAYVGIVFPAFIRNAVYRLVAKNRYHWFGKKEECWLPTPELKSRFIDI